jgi:molecular chaperone GrpE
MDTNESEERVVRIKVRQGDDGPAEPRHPADGIEPPVHPAAGGPLDAPGSGDAAAGDELAFTLDLDAKEAPAAAEEPTVARSRYLETARESMRLGAEVRRLQSEAYESKAKAQTAESNATDLQSQLLRSQAEFQNYRRRVDKERDEALRYAHADLIRDLLPVLDNFERAMKVAPKGEDSSDFYKGIELIYKQVQDVLGTYDLKALAVLGELFDPNVHEAVTRSAHPAIEAVRVSTEHQKGYLHKDRLLRPALVGVSTGSPEDPPAAPGGEAGAPREGSEDGR